MVETYLITNYLLMSRLGGVQSQLSLYIIYNSVKGLLVRLEVYNPV
jgi:hypothetical protein